MALSTLVFWLTALLTGGSALVVIGARNILHAGFALCLTFLGVGALYVFLHADFVAAVQLIVYVGGILVLIMFAVMFSSNVSSDSVEGDRGLLGIVAGALAGLAVFSGILLMIQRLDTPLQARNTNSEVGYSATIGVTPPVQTPDGLAILARNADLAASISTLNAAKARTAVMEKLGEADGSRFFDAWLLSKGESGLGHVGIGHKLIGEYVLPFELVSILLLAALIGAVVIVRKELT